MPVMSDQAGYAEDTDKTLEPAKRGLSTNSDLRPMFLGPGGNDSLPDCRLSMHDLGGEWYSLDGCRVGRVDGGYMHWDPSYNFAPTPFEIVQEELMVQMELMDRTFRATYAVGPPAVLHWSDGESWVQDSPGHGAPDPPRGTAVAAAPHGAGAPSRSPPT